MFSRLSFNRRRRRASDAPIVRRPVRRRAPELERLISGERIEILFQPQFSIPDGKVVGVEALARGKGSSCAETLFAEAAKAGLSERLSRSIQRQAFRAAAGWTGALASLKLSINLLPEDIGRPGFDAWLLKEAVAAGISPNRITVEITEGALIRDAKAAAKRLGRLRAAGVTIAIDDFGTGYASLAYLGALPLDLVKIDRSLIADIATAERSRIVVQAMVRLARDLGLKLLVEGVESEAQLRLLEEWGCDAFQGFLGAPPLSAKALKRFVETERPRAA
ncbi:MAG TPA: EAL domain-containing protein [Sphingomicrobium sp.]|nr:EAL domain-containing protein [Sphingomicrobium sp.]